ncbi:hypothetical protein [Paenibacillus pinistramenti]|uniref:hypothetical protein n=1 Tax=Paenibacillus pinistramenti TaxID=1768003 RepID=UPI001108897F|nr:hypothetical protein [Paenibacillus pinistramenti]
MKRTNDKSFKGLLIGLAAAVVIIVLGCMFWGNSQSMHHVSQPVQNGFGKHGFAQRGFFGQGSMMMMDGRSSLQSEASSSNWALVLIKIAFILTGLILWSCAKKTLKWFGAAVFVIGLFTLMPFWLAAAATALIAYILYRIYRNNQVLPVQIESVSRVDRMPIGSEADLLDEWERSITKEDK